MGTNFPTSLDTYTPLVDGTDIIEADRPNDMADAIEALEAKVGINGSAVATSHDYLIANIQSPKTVSGSTKSVTFKNGLILKWGRTQSTQDTEQTFTFDTAYPNECFVVLICREDPGQTQPLGPSEDCTTTGFKINRADTISNCYFHWIAIGY